MIFDDQWKEICDDFTNLLNDIASNGMTQTNSSNVTETEKEILQVISLIPSYFMDFQHNKNKQDISKSDADLFVNKINQLKKQAELALTILSEFHQETSSIKMQNMLYTWELRNEIL